MTFWYAQPNPLHTEMSVIRILPGRGTEAAENHMKALGVCAPLRKAGEQASCQQAFLPSVSSPSQSCRLHSSCSGKMLILAALLGRGCLYQLILWHVISVFHCRREQALGLSVCSYCLCLLLSLLVKRGTDRTVGSHTTWARWVKKIWGSEMLMCV